MFSSKTTTTYKNLQPPPPRSLLEKLYYCYYSKKSNLSQLILIFLLLLILISSFFLFTLNNSPSTIRWLVLNNSCSTNIHPSSSKINTLIKVVVSPPKTPTFLACVIPKLNPFDTSIKNLTTDTTNITCTTLYPPIFQSTNKSLIFLGFPNPETKATNFSSWGPPCFYQTITRGKNTNNPDNAYDLSKEKFTIIPLNISSPPSSSSSSPQEIKIPPHHEFIAISCKFRNGSNGQESVKVVDTHLFVRENPDVERRVNNYYKQLDDRNNNRVVVVPPPLPERDRLNVVMLGIDAVSHMNFLRTMQKSYRFLKNDLSAIEMQGYNKVGDNTYPNIIAVMTPDNQTTLESSCVVNKTFDNCDYIWKEYAANGYRTSYGEDAVKISAFNYLQKGFVRPPTDYYLRPYALATEALIGHNKPMNANFCYGPRLSFAVLLDYLRKMAAWGIGDNKRYFQFVWSNALTHDYLNSGVNGDEELLSTLKWFQGGGYLNNTVLILMSDHGIRWGKIHNFIQGKLEVSLPFLFFVFPEWFKKKYSRAYANFKDNQERLSTPFDLHETLRDILHLNRLEQRALIPREVELIRASKKHKPPPRGISQFLPIPLDRNCAAAEIAENYCTCHRLTPVGENDKEAKKESKVGAEYIVKVINGMLSGHAQCSELSVFEIKTANLIESDVEKIKEGKAYQLSVETKPGGGLFEASVVRGKDLQWSVEGGITRTNLYGNQSYCVSEKELKLYCYCDNDNKGS